MNNEQRMLDQISNVDKEKNKLLLHVCCAPCSTSVIERLSDIFDITLFFYNPNITEPEEYKKRLEEVKKFVSLFKNEIKVTEGRYEVEEFFSIAKGLEKEKERGKRCYECYKLRLMETAVIADKNNFDYFATTLTLSPYKNTDFVNEIGADLDKKYSSTYLYSDFKKKNGYKRSIELSDKYNLYRQDYCGCIYSKNNG